MIQTYVINQNDLYEWFEKSFNWAIAFVDTPLIFSKVTTSIRGSHNAGVNILTKSNNATCYYHEYEHGGHNQGDVRIQFLAIGRWK
ncbi:phage tail protein [Avibacterium paragallinarum]|nr:phage tail protein [Avibacterium paragallinarum]RZN74019.1 phage tail protein [Avibacterium paragallinarum]